MLALIIIAFLGYVVYVRGIRPSVIRKKCTEERLGHQNDEITKRVYLHVIKTMKKEASQKFSELMEGL